jgi:cytokinin dehydrogenase
MPSDISRRAFLTGLTAATATLIVGFDPAERSWITAAHAAGSFDPLPPLDGALLTDDAALTAASGDYGRVITRRPMAVLKPGSVQDIATMVRFARRRGLKIAARGQGHSTYGQGLSAGVVIDMSTLNTIHRISADGADVDAGVRWLDLLQATVAQGLTPPVLTDYLELSIAGTLSVGGIGGASHRYGVQADNALELQVVTGEGKLETCSATRNTLLFNGVLAGLGQFGIIVRAKLRLIPSQTRARTFQLFYTDARTMTQDQQRLIFEERFSFVEGQVLPNGSGGWNYILEASMYFTPPALPDNTRLLAGLRFNPAATQINETSYFDWANRLGPLKQFLISIGEWQKPHPWFDIFMPGSKTVGYVDNVVSTLTPADLGASGLMLLYPVKRSRLTRPFFRVPNEPVVFLFDILTTAPDDPATVQQMVQRNRRIFEQGRALGGYRYAISAIPFNQADWRQHFGPTWALMRALKAVYDPDNVLAPGQGIFTT